MKPSQKFWLCVLFPLILFLNYIMIKNWNIYTDDVFSAILCLDLLCVDFVIVFGLLIYFIPKFNSWLDKE